MIDEKLLEVREYTAPGYKPVIDFGEWRVAVLNYLEEIHPARIDMVERHNETDEVFVLIRGRAILFLGEGVAQVEKIYPQVLELGRVYNVKQGIWHTVVLSQDGSVLIVENKNTRKENSDYSSLLPEDRIMILNVAKREQPDCWM